MLRGVKVLGGMLVFRRIAASHVPAQQAKPEMYPGIAGLEALLATFLIGMPEMDLVEMLALSLHALF
jgi:hypothetical protein